MYYTSIDRSKKLLELGLNPKSADMWWLYVTAQGKHIAMMYEEPDPHYLARMASYGIKNTAIPCWSVGALLNMMPPIITTSQDTFYFKVLKADCGYSVRYEAIPNGVLLSSYQQDLTDACCELIRLLFKHNYIKTE